MINFHLTPKGLNKIQKINNTQAHFTSLVEKEVEPYVPKRDGDLSKSVIRGTVLNGNTGELKWTVPYARYQYYLKNRKPKEDKNGGLKDPLRGSRWLERMKDDKMSDLMRALKRHLDIKR